MSCMVLHNLTVDATDDTDLDDRIDEYQDGIVQHLFRSRSSRSIDMRSVTTSNVILTYSD